MIKTLLKLGVLLVVGILVYNFLFGTTEEKEQSKEVFKSTGAVISSTWNLLKAERQKFDAGKYDQALDKLGGAYRAIRDRAQYVDEKVLSRLDDLENRKAALEKELDGIEAEDAKPTPTLKKGEKTPPADSGQIKRKEQLMKELDDLMGDTEKLLKQAEEHQ